VSSDEINVNKNIKKLESSVNIETRNFHFLRSERERSLQQQIEILQKELEVEMNSRLDNYSDNNESKINDCNSDFSEIEFCIERNRFKEHSSNSSPSSSSTNIRRENNDKQISTSDSDFLESISFQRSAQLGDEQLRMNLEAIASQSVRVLHYACRYGHTEVVRELVVCGGLSPSSPDKEGKTPLMACCLWGRAEAARLLVEELGAEVCERSPATLWTALRCASFAGHHLLLPTLIPHSHSHSAPPLSLSLVNARNSLGKTALHYAAQRGHYLVALYLLKHLHADGNALDNYRCSPLHLAALNGHKHIVQLLLDIHSNFNINIHCRNNLGKTALHYAVAGQHLDIVNLLILHGGASVDTSDEYGCTALHYSCMCGNITILKSLLYDGRADIFTKDKTGSNPLTHALNNKHFVAALFIMIRFIELRLYFFFSGKVLGVFNTLIIITAVCFCLLSFILFPRA
jgi:ankyrin repeat protein